MFRRKYKYEDEKRPVPVMWTVIIAVAVIAILYVGVYKALELFEDNDMTIEYDSRNG